MCPPGHPSSEYDLGLCPDAGYNQCGFGAGPQIGSDEAFGVSWRAVAKLGQSLGRSTIL